jgi:hypothetical protein
MKMTIGFPRARKRDATMTAMTATTTRNDEGVVARAVFIDRAVVMREMGAVRSVDEDDGEATRLEREEADDDDDDDDWIEVDAVSARRAFADFVAECTIEAMASMEGRALTEEEVRRVVQRAARHVERNRGGRRRKRLRRAWRVLKRIYGGMMTMNRAVEVLMNPWSRRVLTFGMYLAGRVAWYSMFAAW